MFSKQTFRDGDMSHEELFGHLASDNFTAQIASEYLEIVELHIWEVSVTSYQFQINYGYH